MIRILHITTVPQTFGFFIGQMDYMKTQGFEVNALSSPGKLLDRFAKAEQVPVYSVRMIRRITPLRDLVAIFQLWQQLRIIRPQIVHAHTPKGGLLGIIAAWLARIPVRIYSIHGLPLMTATGYRYILLRWSEKVSCFLAHQVFCISHSIRKVVIVEGLSLASKVKVLANGSFNGVDATNRFNPKNIGEHIRLEVRRKYGIPDDALVLGFVGRIVHDKGLVELVEAWKILCNKFPTLYLLVVGQFELEDPVAPEVKELLHTNPRICLTGQIDDIPPLYAVMDVLALPSYREGFGVVAIEASAMALPVVATSIPGCIDAIKDGVTGTLVSPHNTQALAEAIYKYLHNPALCRQHGQAGRERVLCDFRCGAIWDALYQEYIRLLQKKGLQVPISIESNSEKTDI